MRLLTYSRNDERQRVGVMLGEAADEVLDIARASEQLGIPLPAGGADGDMITLLAAGPSALSADKKQVHTATASDRDSQTAYVHRTEDVRILAPVPRPPRLRDYLTYSGHASNAAFNLPQAFFEMPIAYDGNPNSVIGTDEEISWPGYTDQLDYELEIALVIGKGGRDLSVAEATDHIAGVTLLNDVSARDIQGYEMTVLLGPNKGKHFCNVLGPCIATLDSVVNEYNLHASARVNGEVWSEGTSAHRQYSFAEVVAWASWGEDLQPGEIIGLGTVEGGCGLELGRWIRPGDVLELQLEGVGILRNSVGAKQVIERAGIPSFKKAPPFTSPSLPTNADA